MFPAAVPDDVGANVTSKFRLAPGAYGVTAEIGGVSKTARATVSGKGQARVVLRFPEEGGAVSPEFKPKT